MANGFIEEFAALVGWQVDDSELDGFEEGVDRATKGVKRLGNVIKVVAGALTVGYFNATNRATTQSNRLAESVNANVETMEALSHMVGEAGFSYEHIITLVEELNNKMGESKGVEEMTAVREATQILGLEFEKLRKMAPEEQFIAVAEAARQMEDSQQAVAAADILLGAEANRIIGILRNQEGSIADIVKQYKEMNFLTERGREGANLWTKSLNDLKKVTGSLTQEIFGLLGEVLHPLLRTMQEWIVANKELIQTRLVEFINILDKSLRTLAITFGILISFNIIKWAISFAAALRAMGLAAAFANAKLLLIPALITAVVVALALLIDDIMTYFDGGESIIGGAIDSLLQYFQDVFEQIMVFVRQILEIPSKIKAAFDAIDFGGIIDKINPFASFNLGGGGSEPAPVTPRPGGMAGGFTIPIEMNVTQQQGESGEEFAERTSDMLERKMATTVRNLNTGVVY